AAPGSFIRAINQDGSVVTAVDQGATPSGWTDDGNFVRLNNSGDSVGIGTALPNNLLHLYRDANAGVGITIENPNAGAAAQERISFGDGTAHIVVAGPGGGSNMTIGNNRPSGTISLRTAAQVRLSVANNGNVGIGTTGPNKKLEVVGSIKGDTVFSNFLSSNSPLTLQAPTGTTRMFINDVNGNVGIGTNAPSAKLQVNRGSGQGLPGDLLDEGLVVNNNAASVDIASVNVIGGTAGSGRISFGDNASAYAGYVAYSNATDAMQVGTGGLNRMHISSTGDVGIGTTGPSARLHVNRGSGQGLPGDLLNEGLVVNNNAASVDIASVNVIGGTAGSGRISFGDNASAYAGYINYSNATDALRLGTAGLDRVHITSSGNVGLGTSSPANKLDVEGGAAIGAGYSGTSAAPANGLLVEGTVGIGTTNTILGRLAVEAPGFNAAGFNRTTSDGPIVGLYQDGVNEGNISVSGTTVSYNAFTGSHYGWTEEAIERGELVSLTGFNRNSHDNPKSEIIYGVKRSSIPNDPACLGSYLALGEPSKPAGPENPHLVMAVGNGDMWVVDEGQNIQPGDYLISSSTPGHAMKDDEGKYPIGHIVARAAEAVDWSAVNEMVGGRKHKKISVLFGNFVRSNPSTVAQTLEGLQEIILKQQKQIDELKNIVLKSASSEMAETER
ncbi:MAG: hypothetical protein L0196_06670, partial [candidate division Zixibacteria bacterium]|nr:hypothetical protein [candidate division Zixibacteria bacterium]